VTLEELGSAEVVAAFASVGIFTSMQLYNQIDFAAIQEGVEAERSSSSQVKHLLLVLLVLAHSA